MPGIATSRSDVAQTTLVYAATLAALALLAATLAYWTQTWFIAQPKLAKAPATAATGNVTSISELFGIAQPHAPVAATSGPEIRLSGVAAASGGGRSYAIVQLDGKEILAVREGENIAPGVRLAEVRPGHVVLERNEAREILVWPEMNSAPEAGPPPESDAFSQGVVPDTYE